MVSAAFALEWQYKVLCAILVYNRKSLEGN